MKALVVALALFVGCLAACDNAVEPGHMELVYLVGPNDTIPGTATMAVMGVRVVPAREWLTWYGDVERCLGMVGLVEAVRWYLVPTPWYGPNGRTVYAQHGPNHQIILNAMMAGERHIVRHEAMHDILERHNLRAASANHDPTYFRTSCLDGDY